MSPKPTLAVVENEDAIDTPEEITLVNNRYFKQVDDRGLIHFDLSGKALRGAVVEGLTRTMPHHAVMHMRLRFSMDMLAANFKNVTEAVTEQYPPSDHAEAKAFLGIIEQHAKDFTKRQQNRIARGEIENGDVPEVFKKGVEVFTEAGGQLYAGVVEDVEAQYGWGGNVWSIQVRVLHATNGKIEEGMTKFSIPMFGIARIDSLRVRKLDAETKAKLQARGEKFAQFATGAVYAAYDGHLIQESWWGTRAYRAAGRVMIDVRSFKQMDSDTWNDCRRAMDLQAPEDDADASIEAGIDPSNYWRCWPYLHGFSFASKQWGRLDVAGLRPIAFREDAYDKLVLDEDDKVLIKALVQHGDHSFGDIIDSKGGGTIFLLHGEPGKGKTLTAEAVSELLHRPLYAISVGELGTDPQQLETALRAILDVAMTWNAVILLDEADIFLEERDEKDIVRNAMVGVFLRLLEYHQGVMFLTTNRVKNIDSAFYSRISLAIRFGAVDSEWRKKVWTNLLNASGTTGIDVNALAHYDLNGRQIKNSIRHAQTLARCEGVSPTIKHIERFVERAQRFAQDIRGK